MIRKGNREQECDGDGSQGKDRLVGGGGKGRVFGKNEEIVDSCGARNLGEEEVLGDI